MENGKTKFSVIIIAGNEEKNITDCLKSVIWADEIILVDSESKDSTVKISKEFTDKVYIQKWQGFAKQRIFALSKANNKWVLSIDADERVSPELQNEIQLKLKTHPQESGYYIKRLNHFLNKEIKSCFWYPDYQLRLFRKGSASVADRKVHEGFIVEGKTEKLMSDIIHYTHQSLHETFEKVNKYTSLNAEERKLELTTLYLTLAAYFIFRKGYKYGICGMMVSIVHSITVLQVYMKIWEIQNVKEKTNK